MLTQRTQSRSAPNQHDTITHPHQSPRADVSLRGGRTRYGSPSRIRLPPSSNHACHDRASAERPGLEQAISRSPRTGWDVDRASRGKSPERSGPDAPDEPEYAGCTVLTKLRWESALG